MKNLKFWSLFLRSRTNQYNRVDLVRFQDKWIIRIKIMGRICRRYKIEIANFVFKARQDNKLSWILNNNKIKILILSKIQQGINLKILVAMVDRKNRLSWVKVLKFFILYHILITLKSRISKLIIKLQGIWAIKMVQMAKIYKLFKIQIINFKNK